MFYKAPRLLRGSSRLNQVLVRSEKHANAPPEEFFNILNAFPESGPRVSPNSTESDFSALRTDSWVYSGTPQHEKWIRTVHRPRHFPSSKKVTRDGARPKLQPLKYLESLVEFANSVRSGNRIRADGSRLADRGRRWEVEERTMNECPINGPSRVVFFWDTFGDVHTLISRVECWGDGAIDVDLYVYAPQYELGEGDRETEMEFILAITCPAVQGEVPRVGHLG
ncbi:hypothetical protein DFP72DRAFT_1060723 [Ephemerocybe angulata]|uniref:Uncharacterized protein n=1 Tax=Ephemerocybe angulata TaxID=980116 RepID=A0A8H6IDZ2_9AGAR|nr:hypothetical protein DFP72DRAFT_1060723 [Tulosesus angulatus]